MLNSEISKRIETLVDTSSQMYYSLCYDPITRIDFPLIRILPKSYMTIKILDDRINGFPYFKVEFSRISRIMELTIIIESGKFPEITENSLNFSFQCNNLIDKLIIIRNINENAHILSPLSLFYNTNLYRYIEFTDDFIVKGRPYPRKENKEEWNLILKNH